MMTLTIDGKQFKSISITDCLNYSVTDTRLESLVKSFIESYFKKIKETSLTTDKDIEAFLRYMLLKLSTHNTWLTFRDSENLNQIYLYTIIKKYLFLINPDFI